MSSDAGSLTLALRKRIADAVSPHALYGVGAVLVLSAIYVLRLLRGRRLLGLESANVQGTGALQQEVSALHARIDDMGNELRNLRRRVLRLHVRFSVGQYNILAGYMGNNKEPWFLYGADVTKEQRQEIYKLYEMKGANGEFLYGHWPLYVQGILSADQQAAIERVDKDLFEWTARKDRLLEEIRRMDVDILSLVECDHYYEHFEPGLAKLGYQSTWQQRPRKSSHDGCCIAWRQDMFEFVAERYIYFVDGQNLRSRCEVKDRMALMVLLRVTLTGDLICFVSVHLARNPERVRRDRLRGRQIAQLMLGISEFTRANSASKAPVLLAGDMNATSFGRVTGIANAISLLCEHALAHPFTFASADVPTGATSVTTERNVRIDGILYQSSHLELVDVEETPALSTSDPIPNSMHPSDHVPISATFFLRSGLQMAYAAVQEWYRQLVGRSSSLDSFILDAIQLHEAFKVLDHDGTGCITRTSLCEAMSFVLGKGVAKEKEIARLASQLPAEGIGFEAFAQMYGDAIATAGLPCQQDLKKAFSVFDGDESGGLSLQDLLDVFEDCSSRRVPKDEVAAMFACLDKSKTGSITLDEFLEHLSEVWRLHFMKSFPKRTQEMVRPISHQQLPIP